MSKQTDLINIPDAITVDGSNNVGIGTDSPTGQLHIKGDADMGIRVESAAGGYSAIGFGDSVDTVRGGITYYSTDNSLQFRGYNNTERMRIDTSGNLLVGTTNANIYSTTTTGINLNPDGPTSFNRNGGQAAMFNRINSDGDIVQFRKNGSTVGTIAANGGSIIVGSGNTGLYFDDGSDRLIPVDPASASGRDNAVNLGGGSERFKDLYLSGGVYLGGTGSANKLTDYEQGTWTPVDTNGNAYNQAVTSTYVKIGKLVYIYMDITSNSNTLATNNNQVAGLPFTTATSSNAGTISQGYNTGSGSVTGHMYGTSIYLMNGESTAIVLNQRLMATGVYHAN